MSIQPSIQPSPKRRKRFQVRKDAPGSRSSRRGRRSSSGGISAKRGSRPTTGVDIQRRHDVAPGREEQVPVRVHEPPPPVALLHPEEARGPGLRGLVAAVGAVAEVAGGQGLFFGLPRGLQLLEGGGPHRSRLARVLAQGVDHGQALQYLVAGGLSGERQGADLQGGRAHRVLDLEADGLHRGQGDERPPEAEVVAGPRPVPHRRHVVPRLRRRRQHLHRDRGPDPDVGVGEEQDPAGPVGGVDAEVDPLGRRRPDLEDQRLVPGPVPRQLPGQVGQGQPVLGLALRGIERESEGEAARDCARGAGEGQGHGEQGGEGEPLGHDATSLMTAPRCGSAAGGSGRNGPR